MALVLAGLLSAGGGAILARAEEEGGSTDGVAGAPSQYLPSAFIAPSVSSLSSSSSSSAFASVGGDAVNVLPAANDPVTDGTSTKSGRRRAQSTSGVSGRVFFDSHIDGTHDMFSGSLDFGISGVVIKLFSCADDETITSTVTDASGYYSFEGLPAGQYYIGATPPRYYEFTNAWAGATDEASVLLHPKADSGVDPYAGSSECFDLEEGGNGRDVNIGLKLDIPSIDGLAATTPPPAPALSTSPTLGATSTPPTTNEPSKSPSTSPETAPPLPMAVLPTNPPTTPAPSSPPTNPPAPMGQQLPSAPPTRTGDLYGPTVSERLTMTIRGIDRLEDEEAWSLATADYIMSYFNTTNDDPGVFDVTASVQVTDQTSSDDALFQRRLLDRNLRGQRAQGRSLQEEPDEDSKYVKVFYDQTSSYKTTDLERYDHIYVATEPFDPDRGMEWYVGVLKTISAHYEGVTSAEMAFAEEPAVAAPPPPSPPVPAVTSPGGQEPGDFEEASDPEGKSNDPGMVTVVAILVMGVVTALIIIALRRRRKMKLEEALVEETLMAAAADDEVPKSRPPTDIEIGGPSPAPNAPPSLGTEERAPPSAATPTSSLADGDRGGRLPSSFGVIIKTRNDFAQEVSMFDDSDLARTRSGRILEMTPVGVQTVDVIAPPGRLRVQIETPVSGGVPCVRSVEEDSPVAGELSLGDQIVAVDGEDVRGMSAMEVCALLERKAGRPERRIAVLREASVIVSPQDGMLCTLAEEEPDVPDDAFIVSAPPGDLGIVIACPPSGGTPCFLSVADDSPLFGQVRAGDKMLAVDEKDARQMTAVQANYLLQSRSGQAERKIAVLREEEEEATGDAAVSDFNGGDAAAGSAFPNEEGRRLLNVRAPAGKLGLALSVTDDPGDDDDRRAYVLGLNESSRMVGKLELGDKIVAVDDEDVRGMMPAEIAGLLARKASSSRKITVSREVGGGGGGAVGGGGSDDAAGAPLGGGAEMDFVIPPGKLDVVLSNRIGSSEPDSTDRGSGPLVARVNQSSPMIGKLRIGDRIVAVDGEDVTGMTGFDVTALLAAKRPYARRITVFREIDSADVGGEGGGQSDAIDASRRSDDSSHLFDIHEDDSQVTGGIRSNVVAPPGKLGICLTTTTGSERDPDDPACVSSMSEDGPMKGKLRLGDKIVAVDGEDTREMTATEITQLLGSKSSQSREITVLRESRETDFTAYSEATTSEPGCDASPDEGGHRSNVLAPPGRLGISLTTTTGSERDPNDPACVSSVSEDGPMKGKLRLGDKIVAVDGEDTRKMRATEITQLLGSKSSQSREITVLRESRETDFTAYSEATTSEPGGDVSPDKGGHRSNILAPPGKLGISLTTTTGSERDPDDPACVSRVNEDSPMKGKLRLGDKIVAVDGEDTRNMRATEITQLLGSKSSQSREITVLREIRETVSTAGS